MPLVSNKQPGKKTKSGEKELVVLNEFGLQARTAARFVRCAMNFKSDIHIVANGRRYLSTSIMDVLLANLNRGAKFTVIAGGPDADIAVETLDLLLAHFAEEEDLQKEVSADRRKSRREVFEV